MENVRRFLRYCDQHGLTIGLYRDPLGPWKTYLSPVVGSTIYGEGESPDLAINRMAARASGKKIIKGFTNTTELPEFVYHEPSYMGEEDADVADAD